GTDRLWEVSRARVADVYVNIQGDEPLVTCGHIETLVHPFLSEPEVQVTTLKIRATPEEAVSPTVNKVVTNAHGDALYFSKHAIPYDRDKRGVTYWKHIGLYAYRRPVLDVFHRLPPSTLELAEGLEQLPPLQEGIPLRGVGNAQPPRRIEQLRLLEEGIPIRVLETAEPTVGVDTEEDLRAVEAVLARRGR